MCVYIYVYMYMCTCMCVYICIYVCVYVCICMCIYVYVYIYTHTHSLFRATPAAYGCSQARGPVGAVAADLHQSHSNTRSEPCLRPTPQLKATLDP